MSRHLPVRAALDRLIGGAEAGTRLPAERVLADRLGVGRAAVRHEFADLAHEGRIVVRAQSGSYIRG